MKDTVFKKDILNNQKQDIKSSSVIHNSEFHNKTFVTKLDKTMAYNLRGLRKRLETPLNDTQNAKKHTFLSDFRKLFK